MRRAEAIRFSRSALLLSEVIEQALRHELGLDLLDRLWERSDLPEDEATVLAV
jgi:hypothetical protein